jgi:hypothetical protein
MREAVTRGAKGNARIDTTSESASVTIEEAGTRNNASKRRIGNGTTARTGAATRVPVKWLSKLRSPARFERGFLV